MWILLAIFVALCLVEWAFRMRGLSSGAEDNQDMRAFKLRVRDVP